MSEEQERQWETEGELPWRPPELDSEAEDDAWRGTLHGDDWPENLAGPEYWLYKKMRDE